MLDSALIDCMLPPRRATNRRLNESTPLSSLQSAHQVSGFM
jgi:hypothetical protein